MKPNNWSQGGVNRTRRYPNTEDCNHQVARLSVTRDIRPTFDIHDKTGSKSLVYHSEGGGESQPTSSLSGRVQTLPLCISVVRYPPYIFLNVDTKFEGQTAYTCLINARRCRFEKGGFQSRVISWPEYEFHVPEYYI